MHHNGENMDLKGFILWIGAVSLDQFHTFLSDAVLTANIVYIAYQVYSHHKRHKKEFPENDEQ